MSALYDNVDYNNLKLEYVGPTKDVSFYEYMDSKGLFNAIKNNQTRLGDAIKRQNEVLNKLSNIKIGKKTAEQREVVDNLNKFYLSREKVINFFKDYAKMILDVGCKANHDETKGTGLKTLTPKQMLQRLPIALAQVKAGNNSESLLNEIRQTVYSLYQSKQIIYNTMIKWIE